MEQIEIRSEKVRNLIGIIPPVLIRIGNLLILFLLLVIVIIGSFITVPNTIFCDVQVYKKKDSDTLQLAIISTPKIITKPIEKGKSLKIYKGGVLLYKGTLDERLDNIKIHPDMLQVFVPISLTETIITKEQMSFFLENNTHLICEIEIDNQPIIKNIFKSFF